MVNIALFCNYLILYFIPGGLALAALGRLLTSKDKTKQLKAAIRLAIVASVWGYLLFYYYGGEDTATKAQIGTYQLTDYPACHPCELELKEDKTFVVKQGNTIKETGIWRFESGQDYWITYLNEYDQLGTGKYSYQESHLKYGY